MPTRVYLLGRVEVEQNGRLYGEQQFPGRQGRLLFAHLVSRRQHPVTRQELAEVLWPESLPRAWETALNALASKLRALLGQLEPPGEIGLTSTLGTYLLRVGPDVWIDREAAAEAIDEAEGLLRSNDPKAAWAPTNVAAIIARRPFLPGEDAEWIARERARLQAILLRALDTFAQICLSNGEPALALEAARESIELEPFRETGYQRLMRLHAQVGNPAEALRVYERCRQLLAEELGTDPSAETQQIYLELLGV